MTQPGAPHDQRHNYQPQPHGVPHTRPFPGASQNDHPSEGTAANGQMIAGTQEERLLGAASYLTWLAGFWLVGPIAIYFLFKDKSRFVSFHAVQSVIVSVGLTVLMPLMWVVSMVVSFAVIYAVGNNDGAGIIMVAMYGVWMLSALVPLLFMLLGAWRAFNGVSWRVPLAGRLADRFLTQQSHNPQQGVSP